MMVDVDVRIMPNSLAFYIVIVVIVFPIIFNHLSLRFSRICRRVVLADLHRETTLNISLSNM